MNYKIVGVIIALLLLEIPFLYLSIYLHEVSHKVDYRDIEKVSDEICIGFDCDSGSLGHYKFIANNNQIEQINHIGKWTEIKALFVSFMIMLSYILLVIIVGLYMYTHNKKIYKD